MTTGQQIRKLRVARGLTQSQLGDRIGIDGRNITRYESDRVRPRKDMLQKLAEALEVSVEQLAARSPNMASTLLEDPELLEQFQQIQLLNEEDRFVLKKIINAVIIKSRVHSLTG